MRKRVEYLDVLLYDLTSTYLEVAVKLLPREGELYLLARSAHRHLPDAKKSKEPRKAKGSKESEGPVYHQLDLALPTQPPRPGGPTRASQACGGDLETKRTQNQRFQPQSPPNSESRVRSFTLIIKELELQANRIEYARLGNGDIAGLESLPFHHRDPFDRLLISHALENGLVLVTPDQMMARYGIPVFW